MRRCEHGNRYPRKHNRGGNGTTGWTTVTETTYSRRREASFQEGIMKYEKSVYNKRDLQDMLDYDEITDIDCGFMIGYLNAESA